jgi:hypothetical protein
MTSSENYQRLESFKKQLNEINRLKQSVNAFSSKSASSHHSIHKEAEINESNTTGESIYNCSKEKETRHYNSATIPVFDAAFASSKIGEIKNLDASLHHFFQ